MKKDLKQSTKIYNKASIRWETVLQGISLQKLKECIWGF
jgi:hypothetical protein